MGNIVVAGPNEVVVVSGGCVKKDSTYVVGGSAWKTWWVSHSQRMSLEVMTLLPTVTSCETLKGVPMNVRAVAQVRIKHEIEHLKKACEQFLGKKPHEIEEIIINTFAGHLRGICGGLEVEDLYRNRERFAQSVIEEAAPDAEKMGLEILSFTIKDLTDENGFLEAIGVEQSAKIKALAAIAEANANRDACIKEESAMKESTDICFKNETDIDNYRKEFLTNLANFECEVNTAQTQAAMAYDLQSMKQQQEIVKEEMGVELIERYREIEVEELEILRQEKTLTHTTRLPADAEAFRIRCEADANKSVIVKEAAGNAEKIRLVGKAEASVIEAIGNAEANQMLMKASAYREYGQAATTRLVLDSLPKIAKAIAMPLEKIGDMTIVGSGDSRSSKLTSEATALLAELPQTIKTVTGYDITGLVGQIPGAVLAKKMLDRKE